MDRFGVGSFFSLLLYTNRSPQAVKTFFQGKGESLVINGDISVTVLDIDGDDVTLAIDAPEGLEINGKEPSCLKNQSED